MTRIGPDLDPPVATAGPYSPSVRIGDLVAVSGQCGYLPGRVLVSGATEQTRVAFDNMTTMLAASGCTLDDVLSVTVYLTRREDFGAMNDVYATYFPEAPQPARTTVYVTLGLDVLVEIDCLAVRRGARDVPST